MRTNVSHILCCLLLGAAFLAAGCQKTRQVANAPSAEAFHGPAYLHGTIGSMTRIRGFEPMLVSGYGVVVGLDGTGSSEVPAFLREWLINEMRRKGMGSAQFDTQRMTPQRILADERTAVVKVEGLIPPGAVEGTPFDVLVTALDGTQTTSLEGGTLYTTDLAVLGANTRLAFSTPYAVGNGPIFSQPFLTDAELAEAEHDLHRTAVILSGGTTTTRRKIELILNQPSWQRSRLIADRINEKFGADPDFDRIETAVAKTDVLIEINVPRRFAREPERLLALLNHVFLDRAPGFDLQQAGRLGALLTEDPSRAPDVTLAWEALGKTTLPILRDYYEDRNVLVALAALAAGVRMEDGLAVEGLGKLVEHPRPEVRREVGMLLGYAPPSIRASNFLHQLASDEAPGVKVAAYESILKIDPRAVQSHVFYGQETSTKSARVPAAPRNLPNPELRAQVREWIEQEQRPREPKFALHFVRSTSPMIFISQVEVPRIVIFNADTTVGPQPHQAFLAKMWDNHLMIRGQSDPLAPLSVFYQPSGETDGKTAEIAPALGNLIMLLANRPSFERNYGFDLGYSQVCNAIYQLHEDGLLDASLEIQPSVLAEIVANQRKVTTGRQRPETSQPQFESLPEAPPDSPTSLERPQESTRR